MRTAFAGKVAAEIEDGVADELAGAVVGDVAAAIDFVDFDAFAEEESSVARMLARVALRPSVRTGGCSRRMRVSPIWSALRAATTSLLDGEAFGVGDAAELEEMDVHRWR